MKELKNLIVSALLVCLFSLLPAKAQEKNAIETSTLVLKINFLKTKPPNFQKIAAKNAKPGGGWYALFGRINGWQLPAGELPVRAVNIVSRFESDSSAKVFVSVLTGQRFHEKEESVAAFTLRENENIVVNELKQFGVEAFTIALVRLTPTTVNIPAIVNQTGSVAVVSVEPGFSTVPFFKLKVQNHSNKSIRALAVKVLADGLPAFSSLPHGHEAKTLINANEIFEINMPSASRNVKTADGDGIEPKENQTIVIDSAVFEDGSFEGDPRSAFEFLAFSLGRKLQLRQIIDLLNIAAAEEKPLQWLESEIANLSVQADENVLKTLTDKFPDFAEKEKSGMRMRVEVAMQGVKKSTLDELALLSKGERLPGSKIQINQLKILRDRYQDWLSSLR